MRRIQRWMAGLEILLGLGVAVLAALVVSAGTSLWVDGRTPVVTTPIAPRQAAPARLPDAATVLAALGTHAAADGDARPSLRVWGIAARADERLAVVEEAGEPQRLCRVGDAVAGATIVAIDWNGVTVETGGRRLQVPLETRPRADVPTAAAAPPAAAPPTSRRIRQVSADSFLVDRSLLLHEVGDMSGLLAQLRAVPEVQDGEPVGFRLFSIAQQSIFRRLGLRDGDVVRRVNGSTLRDPAALLSFLQGMGHESRIALDVVGDGRPGTLVYDLR
jgi:general secretion pathway protein C